jgi:hypothetical protein
VTHNERRMVISDQRDATSWRTVAQAFVPIVPFVLRVLPPPAFATFAGCANPGAVPSEWKLWACATASGSKPAAGSNWITSAAPRRSPSADVHAAARTLTAPVFECVGGSV